MTLTLPRRPLLDAVVTSSHGDYVRLQHDATSLLVIGADATTTTATWLPCSTAAAPQSVTVPAKLLGASLKALPGDAVDLDISSRGLKLATPTSRCDVVAQGRLPDLVEVPAAAWRGVESVAALCHALQSCAAAMLDDPARPAVSGVRFDDGVVVAQDGARLHSVRLRHDLGTFTLPAGCVGAVVRIWEDDAPTTPKKPRKGEVAAPPPPRHRVAVGQNFVAFDVVTSEYRRLVVCRRAPEPYAQWRRVLEGLGGAVARIRRADLTEALKRCPGDAVLLRCGVKGFLPGVGAGPVEKPLTLCLDYVVTDDTSTRRLGGGSTSSELLSASGDFEVKVCTRYLLDAAKCCGDEVSLACAPGQPLWVRSGDFEGVVMWQR